MSTLCNALWIEVFPLRPMGAWTILGHVWDPGLVSFILLVVLPSSSSNFFTPVPWGVLTRNLEVIYRSCALSLCETVFFPEKFLRRREGTSFLRTFCACVGFHLISLLTQGTAEPQQYFPFLCCSMETVWEANWSSFRAHFCILSQRTLPCVILSNLWKPGPFLPFWLETGMFWTL